MVYPARFFLGSSTPSARPCLFLCRLFLGSSWLPSFGIAEENQRSHINVLTIRKKISCISRVSIAQIRGQTSRSVREVQTDRGNRLCVVVPYINNQHQLIQHIAIIYQRAEKSSKIKLTHILHVLQCLSSQHCNYMMKSLVVYPLSYHCTKMFLLRKKNTSIVRRYFHKMERESYVASLQLVHHQ